MKRSIPLALLLVAACTPTPEAPQTHTTPMNPTAPDTNAAFTAFSARFLHDHLERNPVHATAAGNHDFDARWPDVSAQGDADTRQFLATTRAALATIEKGSLAEQNRIDASILKNQLDLIELYMDDLKAAERQPLFYTSLIGDGLDPLVSRDFAPLAERMKSLRGRLAGIPAIVAVAKKRLDNPPAVYTETAILQNQALVELCEKGLAEWFAKVPDQRADLEAAAAKATEALRDFQAFLERDLLQRSNGSFRTGRALFEKTLRLKLHDDVDPAALVATAKATLARTQDEMLETAKRIWPAVMGGAFPEAKTADARKILLKQILDRLAEERPDNQTILGDAKALLGDATKFVASHDLVRVPDEPCAVIEMPEYRRGVVIAYCDSSGPLEKKQETFYAISPVPKDWPAARAESFYREYNKSMLANLTVHEAMPGHYLQAMHANRFKSDVRAVFSNEAFVEGWAVYGEWLMANSGFGGPKVALMRQKMLLRTCANTILDHGIHAENMDEAAALALMKNEAFQEEGEAVGKWRRARLSVGQLTTYFYGFSEMMKLRREAEKKPGFSDRTYHDWLLGFGAPPMRHVRELLAKR